MYVFSDHFRYEPEVGQFKFYHHLKEQVKLGRFIEVQRRVILSLSMPDQRRQVGAISAPTRSDKVK